MQWSVTIELGVDDIWAKSPLVNTETRVPGTSCPKCNREKKEGPNYRNSYATANLPASISPLKEPTVNCCALDEDRADCLGLGISQGHVVVGFNGFVSMAVSWLQAAWYTVNDTDWFEEAWDKIKEYAIKEKACAAVDEDDFAIVDHLPNIDAVTSKLRDTNLDSVVLVRKGTGWMMEIPV